MSLAQEFQKIDRKMYKRSLKEVTDLINEGYTPDEALMLAGISGYDN